MFDPEVVRRISETLAAASDERHRLAYAFYAELFDDLPEVRELFPGDLSNHVPRFMGMLQAIPLAVELPDEMRATLGEIGQEHFRLGIRQEHYGPMYGAVMRALARTAGKAWNEAAAEAWLQFLTYARAQMLEGWEAASAAAEPSAAPA